VCQPFALLLQPFEELGVRVLREAADALSDSAVKVRDTARVYITTDTAESAVFTGLEGEL